MFECTYCKAEITDEEIHDAIIHDTETIYCDANCEAQDNIVTMESISCEEYVRAVISNQTNVDELRMDYPEGMSVTDIEATGLFDLTIDNDFGLVIEMDGASEIEIKLTDYNENVNTRYEI